MDTDPALRFVTASLHLDYVRPTPIDGPLDLRSRVKGIAGRKVTVTTILSVRGEVCARGEVIAVQMPEQMMRTLPGSPMADSGVSARES